MNSDRFEKILDSVQSCQTVDQYITCVEWIRNLRELYNFSPKQHWALNEFMLDACIRLGVKKWLSY